MTENEEIPFLEAPFWDFQKKQFIELGIRSWTEKGVPLFPTSNPLFAKQAASIIAGFAKDINEPLTILELAGGTGRFAFLVIKELKKLINKPFRYILTDIAPSLLEFWNDHPLFHPFVKEGILEFALFDPIKENTLSNINGPLFAIASYFFDTTPQDLLKIENGKIYRELFKPSKKLVPYLGEEFICAKNDGYVMLPVGAFKTIDSLSNISKGQFALLTSDRGSFNEETSTKKPTFGYKGSLSFPVDFNLISKYVNSKSGTSLLPEKPENNFIVHLSLLGQTFTHTQAAFNKSVNPFNPGTYSALVKTLGDNPKQYTLDEILGYFQIGNFDPCMISLFAAQLNRFFENVSEEMKSTFEDVFEKIYHHFFITCSEESFSILTLGLLLFTMKAYDKAILFFKRALGVYNKNVVAYFHIALAYKRLGQEEKALNALLPLKALNQMVYDTQIEMLQNA